ncbi:MAG TPA: hypothetical protein VEW08_09600, partial [Steroidobacteraceae bacterium]|nr:hypothetical protein [Steroidobacteraceae bacterium]
MRDLAPDIVRQRLLIEGLFDIEVDGATVERYLIDLAAHLNLRTYGKPIVHAPGGAGKDDNEGFDAFIPLIDSGISLYVWSRKRFFSDRWRIDLALEVTMSGDCGNQGFHGVVNLCIPQQACIGTLALGRRGNAGSVQEFTARTQGQDGLGVAELILREFQGLSGLGQCGDTGIAIG